MWHSESRSKSLYPYTFYTQVFIVKNHWSGSWSLVSVSPSMLGPHWDSTGTSNYGSVSWRSCTHGQDWLTPYPQPILQQITDGDIGVSQHITLVLGLSSCSMGSHVFAIRVNSTVLPWLVHLLYQSLFSCFNIFRSVLPHLHLQDQFYCVA